MLYPTIDSDDPNEILCHAAKIIEEFGWTQNQYGKPTGEVCIVGAIRAAVVGQALLVTKFTQQEADRVNTAYGVLQERISPTFAVANWNDSTTRTKEEVLAVLREGGC